MCLTKLKFFQKFWTIRVPIIKASTSSSWRQKLQELVHCSERFLGSPSLNYEIQVNPEMINGKKPSVTVESQTDLTNPNSDQILEFIRPVYELNWVLIKPNYS